MDTTRNHSSPRRSNTSPIPSGRRRSSVSAMFARTRDASLTKFGLLLPTATSTTTSTYPQKQLNTVTVFEEQDEQDDFNQVPRSSESCMHYELLTEFINLRNPRHCPLGVYVMPSSGVLNVLYGVIFVHKGYYKSGVFKFRIYVPETYPNQPPSVTFLTDMFHPLVDAQGNVSLSQQFPTWRPYQDYLFHILHYLKNMFKRDVLEKLLPKNCYNEEAYRLFRNDAPVFCKLSQQCAQLSITESYLFDHFPDDNMIHFSPLSEAKFDELKSTILKTTTLFPDVENTP